MKILWPLLWVVVWSVIYADGRDQILIIFGAVGVALCTLFPCPPSFGPSVRCFFGFHRTEIRIGKLIDMDIEVAHCLDCGKNTLA